MKTTWASLVFVASALLSGWAGEAYRFTLDGKEIEPWVTPVFGEEDEPAAGDVIRIAGFPMVLGEPGEYAFREDGELRLMGKLPGMKAEACVAVKVDEDSDDKLLDPLSPMSVEQKALLRGLVMEARPPDVEKAFEGVDWDNAMLSLSYGFAGSRKTWETLPWVPREVCYLEFDLSITPSVRDVSTIHPLRDLVFLKLDRGVEIELPKLKCSSRIRHFDSNGATPKDLDAIGSWKALRTLDLGGCEILEDLDFLAGLAHLRRLRVTWCENLRDISAVAKLPRLESLDLRMTPVEDLSAVAKSKELRTIRANFSGVKTLPREPEMPALRKLTLLSTKAAPDDVDRFRAALPECEVLDSWYGSLLAETEGVDRLRVRSGGTCHRRVETEKTLFEVKGAAQIREFVEGLSINEEDSGFHCMCCGEPSLELYRGEELLVTLGFHHGRSLRWAGGEWPGDCLLTEPAADRLCAFMAKHGLTGPLEDREEGKRQEAAMERYREACLAHASGKQLNEWSKAMQEGETDRMKKMVSEVWPDADERAGRLFSLYGVRVTGRWRLSCGLDEMLEDELLELVDAKTLHALLGRDDCPEQAMQGIARRLLFDRDGKDLLNGLPDPLLAKLAAWGWKHPREDNRQQTLMVLAGMKAERADQLLLEFLRESPEPRELPESEQDEPGGQVTYQPRPFKLPDEVSGRGAAALLLGHRQFEQALPLIERLAKEGPEEDRKTYRKAIDLMEKE